MFILRYKKVVLCILDSAKVECIFEDLKDKSRVTTIIHHNYEEMVIPSTDGFEIKRTTLQVKAILNFYWKEMNVARMLKFTVIIQRLHFTDLILKTRKWTILHLTITVTVRLLEIATLDRQGNIKI